MQASLQTKQICGGSLAPFTTICCAFRITLNKMPSIRESLREMGVSVEQVLTEMVQKSTDDTLDKAVPTPLTNYLDVGPSVKVVRGRRKFHFTFMFSRFFLTDSVFWGNQHRLSSTDVQCGV